MSVSEARATLAEIVDRVVGGDEVVLTRHGRPVAVLVRPDLLRTRRADEALATAERIHELIERGRGDRMRPRPALTHERGDALVAELRAIRSGR